MNTPERPGPERPGPDYPPEWDDEPDDDDHDDAHPVWVVTVTCVHAFRRVRWWWLKPKNERWKCRVCGFTTRHYDSIDFQANRPVHGRMSVAMKGMNTE